MVAETALMTPGTRAHERLGAAAVNQIKWRCRRGLLENDLFIERFFTRHEESLTHGQADALMKLMDLADNDLLDLLLCRREPEGQWATVDVVEVLALMRTPA
jgi:antitoxin CptB